MSAQSLLRRSAWYISVSLLLSIALADSPVLFGQDSKPARRDSTASEESLPAAESSPLDEPLRLAMNAREKFRTIQDYSCTFIKQERINGKLLPEEYISMKARTRPFSVYLKWQKPHEGREVIYVDGRHDGKIMVHSTGVEKLVGGTVALDPRGEMAMESSRHNITEAGIGNLIDQLISRWESQKKFGQTKVELKDNATVDGRSCWCVKTTHPNDPRQYPYHRARIFFDKAHGLPIRMEAYDWPQRGSPPDGELVEVYTYRDLKFNTSLTSLDFSVENPKYNFGRF